MTFWGHLQLDKLKHNTTGCFLEVALCKAVSYIKFYKLSISTYNKENFKSDKQSRTNEFIYLFERQYNLHVWYLNLKIKDYYFYHFLS